MSRGLTLGDLSSLLEYMTDIWPSREVISVAVDEEGRATAVLTRWAAYPVRVVRWHDGGWRPE